MAEIYRMGSGFAVKKSDGTNVGLRQGEWYLISKKGSTSIFKLNKVSQEKDPDEDLNSLNIYADILYNRAGYIRENCLLVFPKDNDHLEYIEKTSMRTQLDIMFYKTDKLKEDA